MNEREIFLAALDISDAEAREEYLDTACGGDRELHERIIRLLRRSQSAGDFMESPASALVAALDFPVETQAPGPGKTPASDGLQTRTLGDYRILDEIGRGGMGVVYEAEQISLGRRVALKVLSYASILDKTKLERFKIEARAAASLDHPNVVHVHSVGSQRGVHYYAMQFIEGQTVADVIADERRRRGLDAEPGQRPAAGDSSPDDATEEHDVSEASMANRLEAFKDTGVAGRTSAATVDAGEERSRNRGVVELAIQAADALEHAHRMGIVHRDIKPSNLLVDYERHLWVADFGLAMIETEGNLTVTGSLIGTFRYMSPEQVRGDRHVLDHHTDIYSLGATLYEMLTLQAAFPESDAARLIKRIPIDEPTAPRKLNPAIPRDLETIVLKAMAKDHEDRYATAEGLALDLKRFLEYKPIKGKPPSTIERARKWAKRHQPIVMTAGMTIAVAVLIASGLLWKERNQAIAARTDAETAWKQAELEAEKARQRELFARQLVYAGDIRLAAQAWDRGDVRQYADLLDGLKGGPKDFRGFEWKYLRQLGQAAYRTVAEQTSGTCSVRHSPDGKYLVLGQHDGSIRLLDEQTHEAMANWKGHEGFVRGIDFSPDGNRMASIGEDGIIRVWALPDHQGVCEFQADRGIGFAVFFALAGKILVSCGEEPDIKLWDAETGENVGTLSTEGARFRALGVSPDGKYCVGGGAGITFTWDLEKRKRIKERRGDVLRCLQFSPDGTIYAAGTTQQLIYLCRVKTAEVFAVLEAHEDDIEDLAFRPSGGLLASADRAGVIRTWVLDKNNVPAWRTTKNQLGSFGAMNARTGWPLCFRGHSARIWSLEFSPDGRGLVSGSKDGTVRVWSGRPPVLRRFPSKSKVLDIAFAEDASELFVCEENRIHILNRATDEDVTLELGVKEDKCSLGVSPDGATVVCGDTLGILHFWDRKQGRVVEAVPGHKDDVDEIDFSPDGKFMATTSWDGTAKLWSAPSHKELATFELQPHCSNATFSPCGRLLAIAWEDHAVLYNVATRRRLRVLNGHQNTAACLSFSPDGRLLATGSHDRTVRLWNVESGETQSVIPAHQNKITAVTFSPDGRTVVSGDRGGVIAFSHVETGRFLYTLKIANGMIHDLEFSSDGEVLAAAADDQVVLLQIARDPTKQSHASSSDVAGAIRSHEVNN